MTTMTTEESETAALDNAPVGASFTVRGSTNVWTKQENGMWDCGGSPLAARHFRTYLRGDMIVLNVPAEPKVDEATGEVFREVIPDSLRTALLDLAMKAPSADLTRILEAHQLPVPVATSITLHVEGTADWAGSVAVVQSYWDQRNNAQVTAATPMVITWQRDFTISRQVVPGECICSTVQATDPDIAPHLPVVRRQTSNVQVTLLSARCSNASSTHAGPDLF